MKKTLVSLAAALVLLIPINVLSGFVYMRFDLTEDQRYTLSKAAMDVVSELERSVIVDVLLEGNLPQEFVKLRTESAKFQRNSHRKTGTSSSPLSTLWKYREYQRNRCGTSRLGSHAGPSDR